MDDIQFRALLATILLAGERAVNPSEKQVRRTYAAVDTILHCANVSELTITEKPNGEA